jgi:hypothetical protein
METNVTRSLKALMVVFLGGALSGFTEGGCGGADLCFLLGEKECSANPGCASEFADAPCDEATCTLPVREGFVGCRVVEPIQVPTGCEGLAELACVGRPDCRAVYEEAMPSGSSHSGSGRAGSGLSGCLAPPSEPRFVRCEGQVCPDVTCDVECPIGKLKLDTNGCRTCECEETPCQKNADCASGESCVRAPAPDAYVTCDAESCGAPSPPAMVGVCRPIERGCSRDADCDLGEVCTFPGEDDGTAARGECNRVRCSSNQDCPTGTACLADPNDACSGSNAPCTHERLVSLVCLPTPKPCAGLDERRCAATSGCRAVYGPSACSPDGRTCTADMSFRRCE